MLTLLLRQPAATSPTAIIELNSDGYIVDEIEHGMKRASTLRFRPTAAVVDSTELTARHPVKYTLGGVILFAGRTLPITRRLDATRNEVEYLAADVMEYLATNPIIEENEWYNRSRDANIYPYPTDTGIRTLIETEFNAILGTGKLIGAFDWTEVPAETQALIVYNFQTKGKTWLGLLEAIAAEVPTLAWWYDPSTTDGVTTEGGTLRFYDFSKVSGTTNEAVWARRDGADDGHAITIESIDVSIDISQSYDKITLHGWGDMTEKEEQATAGWDYTKDGVFTTHYSPTILRDSATLVGRVEKFTQDVTGGTWNLVADTSYLQAYYSTSSRQANRDAYRKYKVASEIVDLKLSKDDSVSPARYVSAERSMWVKTIVYGWDAGPIGFPIDSGYYLGRLENSTKFVLFTNGIKDDFGNIRPEPAIYPNYPDVPLPTVEIGTPAAFEKNYFTLQNPRIYRTNYVFDGVSPSADQAAQWANLAGQFCYCYWGVGSVPGHTDIYLLYTGREDLSVVVEDASLGYSKHMELWDQRFFKYTNLAGEVIRNDTSVLTDYANAMFALVSRKRLYGSVSVIAQPSAGFTAHPMGTFMRVRNWGSDGATYTLPVMVQSLKLTELRDAYKLVVGFDSANTFHSLDITTRFRQFFESNQVNGTSGVTGNVGNTGGGDSGGGAGGGGGGTNNGGNGPGGGSGDGWSGGWPTCCQTSGSDALSDGSGSGGSVIPP